MLTGDKYISSRLKIILYFKYFFFHPTHFFSYIFHTHRKVIVCVCTRACVCMCVQWLTSGVVSWDICQHVFRDRVFLEYIIFFLWNIGVGKWEGIHHTDCPNLFFVLLTISEEWTLTSRPVPCFRTQPCSMLKHTAVSFSKVPVAGILQTFCRWFVSLNISHKNIFPGPVSPHLNSSYYKSMF